jgi:hypothetical protein
MHKVAMQLVEMHKSSIRLGLPDAQDMVTAGGLVRCRLQPWMQTHTMHATMCSLK